MICLNSAGDLARSEVRKIKKKRRGQQERVPRPRALSSSSRHLDSSAPPKAFPHRAKRNPGATRETRRTRVALARRQSFFFSTDGRRLPNFRFKGRPSRDDDLSAAPIPGSKETGERHQEQRERSDGRAPGDAGSAICVQRLDDSLNSAIHTRYRSLLRSSSMHEPRGPPLEVVIFLSKSQNSTQDKNRRKNWAGARSGAPGRPKKEFPSLRPGTPLLQKKKGRREPRQTLSNPGLCTWVSAENQRL